MTTATLSPASDPTTTADAIPSTVTRIRITSGISAGTYTAASDPSGRREWKRLDGTGACLAGYFAEKAYRDGRVAFLPSAPMPPPAEPRGTCSLRLTIDGTSYSVRPIDPGFAGTRAFRLRKGDGRAYDVVQGEGMVRCDCGDFVFRRHQRTDVPCKHGAALVALGLLDGPER